MTDLSRSTDDGRRLRTYRILGSLLVAVIALGVLALSYPWFQKVEGSLDGRLVWVANVAYLAVVLTIAHGGLHLVHRRFPAHLPNPEPRPPRFLLPAKITAQAFLIYGWMLTRPYFVGLEPYLDPGFKWLALASWHVLLSLGFQLTKDGLEAVSAKMLRQR